MIYVTGDTHGNAREEMSRFNTMNFPAQKNLTKDDYIIICGDFGFVWGQEETKAEKFWLNWLEDKPWTTLFIDGNHENHDKLNNYPVEEWCGGKIHRIRPSIIHLMRGQVFDIQGTTFATMGGAPSHDIADGIFDPADYTDEDDLRQAIRNLIKRKGGWQYAMYRIKGRDWWESEQPSQEEWNEWRNNLSKHNFKVDYVLTHEAPASVVPFVSIHNAAEMSFKLENIRVDLQYKHWYFGHYHIDKNINLETTAVYNRIWHIA